LQYLSVLLKMMSSEIFDFDYFAEFYYQAQHKNGDVFTYLPPPSPFKKQRLLRQNLASN